MNLIYWLRCGICSELGEAHGLRTDTFSVESREFFCQAWWRVPSEEDQPPLTSLSIPGGCVASRAGGAQRHGCLVAIYMQLRGFLLQSR